MKVNLTKREFSIINQKTYNEFYFKVDYDMKYFLYRFFSGGCSAGITVSRRLDTGTDYSEWKEMKRIGLYFDITMLNIRLALYLYPIVWEVNKLKNDK